MDMQLTTTAKGDDQVVASYVCPCGCTPRLKYERGTSHASDGCCCGNQFAVGPNATEHLPQGDAPHLEVQQFEAPWGEPIQAVWTIVQTEGQEGHGHDHEHEADTSSAVDPVCGMSVDKSKAEASGLHSQLDGVDYWFCGKGCFLEFGEDAPRFLDPSYVKSM
jgi:YHS domain-containing protein